MSQPTPPFAQGVPRTTDGRSSPPARVWDIGPSPLHETGLFATSNINVGEVILSELPLLEFNVPRPVFLSDDDPAANAALEQLRQRIRAMTTEEKKALLDIMWANSRDFKEIPTIEKLDEECEKTITNYSKIAAQLAETFVEHSFPFRGTVDVHRLYRNIHQLNHSCHPNAEAVWNPETGRLVVRAIAEIFDQDEITVSYVNVYNDRSRRWSDLRFQCRCTVCDTDEEAVVKSNTVRRLVGHALATLNRYRDKYFGSAVEEAQVSMAVARSICDQGDLIPMRFAIKVIADVDKDINQASELVPCSDLALHDEMSYVCKMATVAWSGNAESKPQILGKAFKLKMDQLRRLSNTFGVEHPRTRLVMSRCVRMAHGNDIIEQNVREVLGTHGWHGWDVGDANSRVRAVDWDERDAAIQAWGWND